jgi:hypothetical protein
MYSCLSVSAYVLLFLLLFLSVLPQYCTSTLYLFGSCFMFVCVALFNCLHFMTHWFKCFSLCLFHLFYFDYFDFISIYFAVYKPVQSVVVWGAIYDPFPLTHIT